MQIKIVKPDPEKPKEKPFPKLMTDGDLVWLVIEPGKAVILNFQAKFRPCPDYIGELRMDGLYDFTGKIELSNDPQ